ncbi:MAG: hypothetical protein JWN96_3079 [Mycobacterium sp.]|nr:hypothetical protein [Mycobacterium sp.]
MGVRRWRALLVGCGLIAGCGGPSNAPAQLPKVGVQQAAAVATLPATATADTPAGAAAFTRFFYAQVTAAFATRNPELIRRYATAACATCNRYAGSVDRLVHERQRVTPVLFWIRFAESPADDDAATARVDVQYDAPASSRYDARGRLILSEKEALRVNRTVTLQRFARGWKVQGIR